MNKTTVLPITVEGSVLAKARRIYGQSAQIQETDIVVEHVLTASNVSHTFNLNGDGINQRPNELFIGRNDLQIIYALMVGVKKINTALDGNSGNYPVYTYPDLTVFNDAAAGTSVSEAAALMAIWNGTIGMKANTYELLNKERLNRFYNAPETQVSATTQAQLQPSRFVHISQPAILSGRDTNTLEFVAAQGADTAKIGGAAGTQNVLVFHFKSLVIRNGAQPASWTELEAARMKDNLKAYTIDGKILL